MPQRDARREQPGLERDAAADREPDQVLLPQAADLVDLLDRFTVPPHGYRAKYAALLGCPGTADTHGWTFRLPAVLPGEPAPVLPPFAAHRVAVSAVEGDGVPTADLPDGFFVRATDACGAAVVFRGERGA